MLRRSLAAAFVLFAVGGVLIAGEVNGLITKIDGDKITVKTRGKKGEKGEEKEYTLASKYTITKAGKKDDKPTELTKSELEKIIDKGFKFKDKEIKGASAKITTDDDGKVTAIEVRGFGGRPKKDSKKEEKKEKE